MPARASAAGFIAPQLATLVPEVPPGPEWLHEIKFDGYRLEGVLRDGRARLLTRRGLDWTGRFPAVAEACATLPARQAVIDGELVALLPDGRSSFQALQQVMMGKKPRRVIYYVFDLLRLDGKDLRSLPLLERKRRLARLLRKRRGPGSRRVRYSAHFTGRGETVLQKACAMGLEGIIAKRRDSPYQSQRTRTWLKVKCVNRQEFVVLGFTEPKGSRTGLGALLLGVYTPRGRLEYTGKVGTGMGVALLNQLRRRLEPLTREDSPVPGPVERGLKGVTWVDPKLVVEVAFTEWTEDGRLRHPSLVGLREDKPAREVRREKPAR
ncbi:MAG: non-homologous end-joining DNA ligase [Gemmatimonadales bacterium]